MEDLKLKPCPFCGGEAILEDTRFLTEGSQYYYVRCKKCRVSTYDFSSFKKARKAWNRRADNEL